MTDACAGNSRPEPYWQKTYRLLDELRKHLAAIPRGEVEQLLGLIGSEFSYLRLREDRTWIAAFDSDGKTIEVAGQTAEKALQELVVAKFGPARMIPGAALAEPATQAMSAGSGAARPNRGLDSPDRGQIDSAAMKDLVAALRTAKNWMLCDNEFGDPEQFKVDLAKIDTILASVGGSGQ